MGVKIEELLAEFDTSASSSTHLLKEMLIIISEGRSPEAKEVSELNQAIEELQQRYNSISQFVTTQIPKEEFPAPGSSVYELKNALENSILFKYQRKLEAIRKTLETFLAVKSKVEQFTSALQVYQLEAKNLLKEIVNSTNIDIEKIEKESRGPVAFVEALACEDADSQENIEILENASNYFSPRVYLGLMKKKYYIDQTESGAHAKAEKMFDNISIQDSTDNCYEKDSSDNERNPAQTHDQVRNVVNVKSSTREECENNVQNIIESENGTIGSSVENNTEENNESAFVKVLKMTGALIDEGENIGFLKKDVSPAEGKKTSSSIVMNDIRKMSQRAVQKIVDVINHKTFTSIEYMATIGVPIDIAERTIKELHKKGYLGYYELFPIGGFYCGSQRLRKALNFKEVKKYLGLRNSRASEWGDEIEDNETSAATRIALLQLSIELTSLFKEIKEIKATAETTMVATDSFTYRIFNPDNHTQSVVSIGAFWKHTAECDEYLEKVKDFIEECEDVPLIIFAGVDVKKASALAEAMLSSLEIDPAKTKVSLYSLSEKEFYSYESQEKTNLTGSLIEESNLEEKVLDSKDSNNNITNDEKPLEIINQNMHLPTETCTISSNTQIQNNEEETGTIVKCDVADGDESDAQKSDNNRRYIEEAVVEENSEIDNKDETGNNPLDDATTEDLDLGDLKNDTSSVNRIETLIPLYIDKDGSPSDEDLYLMIDQIMSSDNPFSYNEGSFAVQATVLAKAASCDAKRKQCNTLYKKLLMATNLTLDDHSYTSTSLSALFQNQDVKKTLSDNYKEQDEALKLSAYLYALFAPGIKYDFGLRNQAEIFLGEYEKVFPSFPSVKSLFSKLITINKTIPIGFNDVVIGLLGDAAESEKFIEDLEAQAKELLVLPNIGAKGLYSRIFVNNSSFHTCMQIIAENNTQEYEYVQLVLEEYCDHKDGTYIINKDIVEEKFLRIKNEYKEAHPNENPNEAFEGSKLQQALRHYYYRLNLMIIWIEHINIAVKENIDLDFLKSAKNEIINLADEAIHELNPAARYYHVVRWTLNQIKSKLVPSSRKLYTEFAEFLYSGIVPLDSKCIPIINPNMDRIKYYEPWRNVLKHIISPVRSYEEATESIWDDSSIAFDNLHQLELIGKVLNSQSEDYYITEKQLTDAVKSAEDNTTRFKESLELAFTYDRISETDKENLSAIMAQFKGRFFQRKDFGMWKQFLHALGKRIDEISTSRKEELRKELNARWNKVGKDKDSPILHEAKRLLEEDNNFAVAEDYINRFDNGETSISDDLQIVLHDPDTYTEFLSDEVFEKLYKECAKNKGHKTLKIFGWDYVSRNLPDSWTARLREDSKYLLYNWPTRRNTASSDQIKQLFTRFGFDVTNAQKAPGSNEEIFQLYIKPSPKGKIDYRHPIAAFGTQIKSPINVVMLYGNFPAQQLVDKITNLNLGGIAIVLVDHAIDRAVRRQISEIFHTRTSGHNRFIVIDQVLALFLAMHQSTERLPILLKCTLPYTTYQPFVRDGGSTADEMFCGRLSELNTIIDPNGASVVYGGRQLGKTALLERAESRCNKPDIKEYAVYCNIINCKSESELVERIRVDVKRKTGLILSKKSTIKALCESIDNLFSEGKIVNMLLLLDEADNFLASISHEKYIAIQPLINLKRERKNNFKFVLAGLHNVCRAEKATSENGVFGQLGTPLCIKPLSPTDALQLLSRPLRYLGFQIDRYPHLETILTNTNYYPGILQFFGYMLVETLTGHYGKYYRAVDGNPPFTLQDDQLGAVMNSADLNRSIRDKFRWSLELDPRYYMIARCIAFLYYYKDEDSSNWLGYSVQEIMAVADEYNINCLRNENVTSYKNLLDEMVDMGILSQPESNLYRMRRSTFINIIGSDLDAVDADITLNNKENM